MTRRGSTTSALIVLMFGAVFGACVLGTAPSLRLSPGSLDPGDPGAYLASGEWVLIHARDAAQRDLAREILARALVYAHEDGRSRIASSAAIALASSMDDRDGRRFYWDLALAIDPSRLPEWEAARRGRLAEDRELDAMALRCLSSVRLHDMPTGADLFGRARVASRIRSLASAHGFDPDAMIALIAREIESARSDACRGRLFVGDRSSRGDRVVCPDHLRGVGLAANDRELAMFLTLEAALIGADATGWQGAWAMGGNSAASVPSVDRAIDRLGVRPDLPFYRDGRWVADP